jgi:AcrR family transcriptional regulator
VPKLWDDTVEAHRRAVRDAILETTAALAAQYGLASVTMAQIAREAGIGRATLYKYFPDVESILAAWHERHVAGHLAHLEQVCDQASTPGERLVGVLHGYAFIVRNRPSGTQIAAVVHPGDHLARARQHLSDLIRDVLAEAIGSGYIRGDTPPAELAAYCLHALAAAADLPSDAAVHRLVAVTLGGLRAPGESPSQQTTRPW